MNDSPKIVHRSTESGDIFKLTQRAAMDEYEFFAEAFAMYIVEGESEVSDEIVQLIKEVSKNG